MLRKKPDTAILPLANRMFAEGVKASELLPEAGVAPSTWSRYVNGAVPDLKVLRRIENALNALLLRENPNQPTAAGAIETGERI